MLLFCVDLHYLAHTWWDPKVWNGFGHVFQKTVEEWGREERQAVLVSKGRRSIRSFQHLFLRGWESKLENELEPFNKAVSLLPFTLAVFWNLPQCTSTSGKSTRSFRSGTPPGRVTAAEQGQDITSGSVGQTCHGSPTGILYGCNKLAWCKPATHSTWVPVQVLIVGSTTGLMHWKKTEQSREVWGNCCS